MENSPKNSIITQENEPRIYNGAFIVARQILNNELWLYKPASWAKIWIYILARVNFADNGKFKRGEGYFNFRQEAKNIGLDVTTNKIKKFMRYARRVLMISTRRSTRGMIIKVLNYDKYQTLDNYSGTMRGTKEAPEKNQGSTPIDKNGKNEKKKIQIPCGLPATKCESSSFPTTYTTKDGKTLPAVTISVPKSEATMAGELADCGALPKRINSPIEAPFDSDAYIEKLINDKQRHINIIGDYFIIRKNKFPDKAAADTEMKRWLKPASELSHYPEGQLDAAFRYIDREFPEKWNLSTMAKYINNQHIKYRGEPSVAPKKSPSTAIKNDDDKNSTKLKGPKNII